jgi:intermembrane space import and assembly protein 40
MFRAARFNTIRRTLHTQARPSSGSLLANRLAFTGAASAVALTYLAWRTSSPSKQLAMDTNKRIRESGPNYRQAVQRFNGFRTTAERTKVVDHVAHLEPGYDLEPEPTPEQTKTSATTATGEGDELEEVSDTPELEGESSTPKPEGDSSTPEPGASAYNPETGEINWDCPCLGGMAHGPCGMQFREAFSCFVFSEQEPKGIDCVEKFKAMQDCFREHPDVYAEGMPAICLENEDFFSPFR